MKVVLDVNVVISALIRDSTTRKIILNSEFSLYFPEPSLHKIRKYKNYIMEKSGISEQDYDKVLSTLFKYIKLVPNEEVIKNWDEAKKVIEKVDKEDVIFVATALGIEDSLIWSDDKHFDRQNKIRIIKTKHLI